MILPSLSGLASTADIRSLITSTANQYGVPPQLALAVATRESSLNPNARGSAGEIGLFQLMPATAAGLGVSNPSDPAQNAQGGIRYLSQLHDQYGDWYTALVAYNEGPGALASHGVYPVSGSYASDILAAAGLDSTETPALYPSEDITGASDGSGDVSFAGLSLSPTVLVGSIAALGLLAFAWARN